MRFALAKFPARVAFHLRLRVLGYLTASHSTPGDKRARRDAEEPGDDQKKAEEPQLAIHRFRCPSIQSFYFTVTVASIAKILFDTRQF